VPISDIDELMNAGDISKERGSILLLTPWPQVNVWPDPSSFGEFSYRGSHVNLDVPPLPAETEKKSGD